jgi:hypothetical protein
MKVTTRTARLTRTLVLSLGVAALLGGIAAAPARADDDDWHHERHERRERREHAQREREAWCAYHPGACGYPQRYVYAPPPPVVYAPPPPPPVVFAPPSGLNIVVPIHIR